LKSNHYLTLNTLLPMKKHWLLYVFMLSGAILCSCKKDEMPEPEGKGKGRLKIEIGLFVQVNEISNSLKSTQSVDNFIVEIYKSDGVLYKAYSRAADMPDLIELPAGVYYVTAHSGNRLPAAFENPYYYGKTANFTIGNNEQKTVVVNCELANCVVTVVYSAQVKSNFNKYEAVIKKEADSLVFSSAETRAGYFEPGNLSIKATLSYLKGSIPATKILTGTISNAQPKKHYEIRVDAVPDNNGAVIQIKLDESVDSTEIIALNEDVEVLSGPVPEGGLIISEIMANPAALDDAAGEWFEIYNALQQAVNLQNLVIRRDEANIHIISEPIILLPGHYYALARSAGAFDGEKYVYGSSITLSNTSARLSISNYGTNGADGSEIFAVTYGGSGFSVPNGASLSLNPLHMNATDAQSGNWWCIATSAYNTADYGTPGKTNDNCN
jgi:hypothetical protein